MMILQPEDAIQVEQLGRAVLVKIFFVNFQGYFIQISILVEFV